MVNTWATLAAVADVTGVTVDATDLAMAQSVIEIYANRTYEATPGFTPRDLGWLSRAVCWQAAWLSRQFGFAFRQSGNNVGADGQSISRNEASDTNLAPMAARALRNLSWKGTRTVNIDRAEIRTGLARRYSDFSNEASDDRDDDNGWEPM